jgi:mannose/fructose-specific phosphotransferase system component IIA
MTKTAIVVVTHGSSGADMVDAAERMVGSLDVATVAVPIGEPKTRTQERIEQAVRESHAEEVLFLVDLEGSTPYLCCRTCGGRSVVLTGMNMPMLFKLATANRTQGATALAEELLATAVKSIHIRRS